MNDLFAKHRHSPELIKTVWQEQKASRSCSYIRHKKTDRHANTKLITSSGTRAHSHIHEVEVEQGLTSYQTHYRSYRGGTAVSSD